MLRAQTICLAPALAPVVAWVAHDIDQQHRPKGRSKSRCITRCGHLPRGNCNLLRFVPVVSIYVLVWRDVVCSVAIVPRIDMLRYLC
jgi:hypothetical protein